jgi:hypothetical protein
VAREDPIPEYLQAMGEATLQAGILDFAGGSRWYHHHNYDSRKSTVGGGFPDLVLGRLDWGRLIVAELKDEASWPTAIQRFWLDMFASGGVETYLVKPRWYDQFLTVLDRRERPTEHPALWIPGDPGMDNGRAQGQKLRANRKGGY